MLESSKILSYTNKILFIFINNYMDYTLLALLSYFDVVSGNFYIFHLRT